MTPHVDILEQPTACAPSFFGSLAFHVTAGRPPLSALAWMQSRNTISLGDPERRRPGIGRGDTRFRASAARIAPLPRTRWPRTPSRPYPTPVSKAKPAPKVTAPDPKAIPIPSRDAKLTRPSPRRSAARQMARPQKDLPNQVYSTAGTRVSTPDFALAGGGGVGVGNNSPFGNQFGAYADLLRTRVAQYWKTTDIRGQQRARSWA